MNKTWIKRELHDVHLWHPVLEQIISSNLHDIQGTGLFSKMERYAHIALKISRSEDYQDMILWNVTAEQIPLEYRTSVNEYLSFFVNYITALKGRSEQGLTFDIYDGTFNRDSHDRDFGVATAHALRHCFDPSFHNPNEHQLKRIADARSHGPDIAKERARWSDADTIFTSLSDTVLNQAVSHILSRIDTVQINTWLEDYAFETLGKTLLEKLNDTDRAFLINNHILSPYQELTDTGLAHIAILQQNISLFARFGIYDLSRLYDTYDIAKQDHVLKRMLKDMEYTIDDQTP